MQLICNPYEIIIQGVTESGKTFRPSDWSERLAGILCSFDWDNRVSYSPYLRPIMLDHMRCLAVERTLERANPRAFQFLMNFARENRLRVMDCKTLIEKADAGEIEVELITAPRPLEEVEGKLDDSVPVGGGERHGVMSGGEPSGEDGVGPPRESG